MVLFKKQKIFSEKGDGWGQRWMLGSGWGWGWGRVRKGYINGCVEQV